MSLLVMLLALAPVENGGRLTLICRGAGAARKEDSTTAYGSDNSGNQAWATASSSHSERFDDQVDLWVEGPDGRIRVPRIMLPPIHGGDDGWFKLKNVVMTDDAITGSIVLNPISNPKLHVDRRTGAISIDGRSGHYAGECERYDPVAQPRRF